MQNTVLRKSSWWILTGWCLLAGFGSFIALWTLVSVKAFQPILFAPVGAINKLAWAMLGYYKIIPDGHWSTLFVSAYFFALGPLIVALAYWRKSLRSFNPGRGSGLTRRVRGTF